LGGGANDERNLANPIRDLLRYCVDPEMRESEIERYFVKRVKEAGGLQRKFVSPGHKDVADRICGFPIERFAFVELKATGKQPRAGQVREHDKWRAIGFHVDVIDTKELVDQFIEFMTRPL
jgi:hypothetical protein